MKTLSKGAQGDDVKRLQGKLGVKVDGDFGSKTEAALIAWQKSNGISPADGVAREDTLTKMGLIQASKSTGLNTSALKGAIPDSVINQISGIASKFGITTNLRLAHFLAQCAQESGVFKVVEENLNYSAKRLLQVFPKKFTEAEAQAYGGKPEKIANRVYANIIGNGDEASGDGYRYRGRGYIQLTGKSNYKAFSTFIGEDCVANPDLVASKYPLASAANYFNNTAKIWSTCDKGSDDATVKAVTKKVNTGLLGLDERIAYFKKYYRLLSV